MMRILGTHYPLEELDMSLQSITGHFGSGSDDAVLINCGINKNRLLISDQEFTGSSRVLLKRPALCPMKSLDDGQAASLPEDLRNRGVDAGVIVILQSADMKVLLTRRAKCLTSFPNVWVPPGGHIEWDEQILDAGLRELEEETGLRLKEGEFTWKIVELWESVFPPLLSRGLPRKHHVVVSIIVVSHETHHQLQEKLAVDQSEVSAYAWLDTVMSKQILSVEKTPESLKATPGLPATVRILELHDSSLVAVDLLASEFLNTIPSKGADVQRVSPGTKFSLKLWLDSLPQEK